jgi:tRNA modification GTPase
MSGIRMAYPGEFSRRAFINGKMSLASAEAVMDVINSETERQLEAAGSLMSGKLAEEIDHIEKNLYDQAAMLETFTEFDTEDDEAEENAKLETVKDNLSDCHDRLTALCEGYGKGRISQKKSDLLQGISDTSGNFQDTKQALGET